MSKKTIYHRGLLKMYYKLDWRPLAAVSASTLGGAEMLKIRSTKPFCQFTLMTRSIVPHVKISKHAFKELSREGYMLTITRP